MKIWHHLSPGIFSNLFTDDIPSTVNVCVSTTMNETLLASFVVEEVKKSLFVIGDLKNLGSKVLNATDTTIIP